MEMRPQSERPHTLAHVSVAPEVTGARGLPGYSGSCVLYVLSSRSHSVLPFPSLFALPSFFSFLSFLLFLPLLPPSFPPSLLPF